MKFPDLPRSGFPIAQTIKDIINYLRSSRIISINGIKGTSTTNGTTFQIPVGEKNRFQKEYLHPFKMFSRVDTATSERRLYLNNGILTTYFINSNGLPSSSSFPIQFEDGASDLSNSDFAINGPEGYFVLEAEKTYGVWIVGENEITTTAPESAIEDYTGLRAYSPNPINLPYVYITDISDQINWGDESSVILDLNLYLCFFIGQVVTDADNVPTIKQFRKSDIFAQMTVLPYDLVVVSEDANNSITVGTDGKAFYDAPPAASADANNSISVGTDGGPYYDAP